MRREMLSLLAYNDTNITDGALTPTNIPGPPPRVRRR